MRVTNSMIANRSQVHISNAKNKLLTAEEQYTSEKKIQRPSDDPTVASRSLKFRTTYAQLKQYAEKNVQDAMEWMDTTESAMDKANSILTDMEGKLSQGANSYPEAKERTAILTQLQQYATAIFEDNANADYAGRYLFTGYRTDTSLLFPNQTESLEYQIKENFKSTDIDTIRNVESNIAYDDTITDGEDYAKQTATVNTAYRMQLSYDNCSKDAITGGNTAFEMVMSYKDANGAAQKETFSVAEGNVVILSKEDAYAYDIDKYNAQNGTDYKAIYIYDAGEIVLSKDLYGDIQAKDASLSVDYTKKSFEKSDIRPEMYFECTKYDTVSMKTINYADPSDQKMNYEVNFSQTIGVNTQAKDAFDTEIYRCLDYIARTIDDVTDVENRISDVEKKIANSNDKNEIAALNVLKSSLNDEKELRVSVMNEAFGKGLTMVSKTQATLNVATAELGAKYNRMQKTYDRLLDEQTDTEEKLSNNEDVDIADAIINLTQADNLYQASLSATSKILGNSLLNYI